MKRITRLCQQMSITATPLAPVRSASPIATKPTSSMSSMSTLSSNATTACAYHTEPKNSSKSTLSLSSTSHGIPGEEVYGGRLGNNSRLSSLLHHAANDYHIEYGRSQLANHLQHGLVALAKLGANDERLQEWNDRYTRKLEAPHPATMKVSEENWRSVCGQNLHFAELTDFFTGEAKKSDPYQMVRQLFPSLMDGLSGRALHGLIQLGYAIESSNPSLLPHGIAYLAFGHRALGHIDSSLIAKATMASKVTDPLTVPLALSLLERVRNDDRFKAFAHTKGSGFDGHLQKLSADAAYQSLLDSYDLPLHSSSTPTQMMRTIIKAAISAFTYTGGRDFFLLHGITAARSLKQVLMLYNNIDDTQLFKVESVATSFKQAAPVMLTAQQVQRVALGYYWRALVTTYHTQGSAAVNDDIVKQAKSSNILWPDVVASGASHNDEHLIKLVFVCRSEQADDVAEQLAADNCPSTESSSSSSSRTKVVIADPLYSYSAHFGLQQVDAHGWVF